jgi:hypothetical protein
MESSARVVARWKDGAPWLVERSVGRGLVFLLTVPTSPDVSDLALRPAFLVLLEKVIDAARTRNGAHRTPVGDAWSFEGASSLSAVGPGKTALRVAEHGSRKIVTPDHIGPYEITVDQDKLTRVAAAVESEVDGRPRAISAKTAASSLGDVRSKVDLSPYLAVTLLALLFAELALRVRARRTGLPDSAADAASVATGS